MQTSVQMRQFAALARLTMAETIRHPVCLMLFLTCVIACAVAPMLTAHEMGEPGRLARDSALAMHLLCGLFVAGYAACASFRRELQTGILSTILSKAVGRDLFFLAKFAGVAGVIVVFSFIAACAAILGQRVAPVFFQVDWFAARLALAAPALALAGAALDNYLTHRPFAAAAARYLALALFAAVIIAGFWNRQGDAVAFGADLEWRFLSASLLVTLALMIMAAIALTLAIRLNTAPVIAILALVFIGGVLSHYIFAGWQTPVVSDVVRGMLPDWQRFWAVDMLAEGRHIPAGYMCYAALYTSAYLAAILTLGAGLFSRAEVA